MRPPAVGAGALCLALLGAGCTRLPTGPAPFHPGVRGVTLVDWSADGYATVSAAAALDSLAAIGANEVAIVVTAYQPDRAANEIAASDPRTPSPGALRAALARARALGLGIAIKPHVDLDDGTWRGRIDPADPAAWFGSYRSFILPLAALAESVGSARFVIGTELGGTIGRQQQWRETIASVRALFSGELVYAASWDEAGKVGFWGDLDLVGVDFYFPVAARTDPGRLEVLAGWQPWLDRLLLLHRQTGREILLTEVGYRSVDGAGMNPASFASDAPLDLGEQADLYWAALQATGDQSWLAGVYWWNWPADGSGGAQNRDYTPRGKPAADVLRSSWGRP